MDTIRKQITIDTLRSHVNGILPFVEYNSDSKDIKEVKPGDTNGNYGGYVCDFLFENAEPTIYGGTTYYPRLKYLDVIRRYRDSKEIMENGILVKKYVEHSNTCPSSVTGKTYWSEKIVFDGECHPEQERFGAKMWDINDFDKDIDGNYIYIGNTAYTPTDTYLLLVNNWGTIEYNNLIWDDWWNFWWSKDTSTGPLVSLWEERYLVDDASKYKEPPFSCYTFIWDVERYILGKIFVPEYLYSGTSCSAITGKYVPNFVFNTNYGQYIDLIDSKTRGSEEWKECGGQEFRDFLTGITPSWITQRTIPSAETGMTYAAPEADISLFFENELEEESLYYPYEYSVTEEIISKEKYAIITGWPISSTIGTSATFFSITVSANTTWTITSNVAWLNMDKTSGGASTGTTVKITISENINNAPRVADITITATDGTPTPSSKQYKQQGAPIVKKIGAWTGGTTIINYITNTTSSISDTAQVTNDTATTDGETINVVKDYDSATTFTLMESGTTLYPHYSTAITGYAESKIESLNSIDILTICEGLTGRFVHFSDDKAHMIKCTYNGTEWTYAETTDTGLTCADGEEVKSGEKKYRNATIAACIEGMVEEVYSGDYYYILARYANDKNNPFTYPFNYGEVCNVSFIDNINVIYDMVTYSAVTDDILTVKYVIGALSGNSIDESGIHYEEEFYRESGCSEVYIDDVYKAHLYWEKASNSGLTKEIYNNEIRLSRSVKRAKITGMEIATTWTSGNAATALLFTKEGSETLQEEPIYDIDVMFDRGLATAWESHFKLSECNTLSDLTNYGNNYFNL